MSKNDQPLVSVVTPVYNGERYLGECIQSVLNQKYQNWEYIIVNNCSTDRSLEIADKYAAKDPRIRVLSNSNLLPMLQNSNYTFQQISSQSRYCKVLHADDWLFPRCLDQMVEMAEAYSSVSIVSSYGLWGDKVVCDKLPFPSHFVRGHAICRDTLLDIVNPFWSPSSLLIRSDVMRSRIPFYNEAHLHADVEACYEILQNSDFGFVHQVLTFIRIHEASITSTVAAPLNKLILLNLDLLIRYGPIYLSPKEYRSHLRSRFLKYYRFLARSLFQIREREFWKYHYSTLKKMGFSLSVVKLVAVAIGELIRTPGAMLKLFFRSLAKCKK
ncbi:MAG: glycosyltransferase family 2 protein [Desulfobacteraceae bacterium]|nr:glycosyltransferase family 2 protein [Desulfobacteraceae bacterium]